MPALYCIAVETEEGWERNVEIIGPPQSGKAKEMRVKFPDGTVEDWDRDDFVPRDLNAEPREPQPKSNPTPVALKPDRAKQQAVLDKKTRKKLEKLRKQEAKEAEKQRKVELKHMKDQIKGKR